MNSDIYNEALDELRNATFEMIGPPDRRNVELLNESTLKEDGSVAQLLKLFRSEAMALLLTQFSGLKIYDIKKLDDSSSRKLAKYVQLIFRIFSYCQKTTTFR